jgi:tetratricopeptide (TPR) repeat protein
MDRVRLVTGLHRNCHLLVLAGLLVASALLVGSGCTRKEGREAPGARQPAVSDTVAYRALGGLSDSLARVTAVEEFLRNYPTSVYRASAIGQAFGILLAKDPARATKFLDSHLRTEKDPGARGRLHYCAYLQARDTNPSAVPAALEAMSADPSTSCDALNSAAWDLVTRGEHLDQAIALAALGVERATNDEEKASVLDTQAWGLFGKGDFAEAVRLLEQAAALVPPEDASEIRGHLALAYDRAGRKEQARDLMVDLLGTMEDPELRAAVTRLSTELGEDPKATFARIDQAREANAHPAPDFTLRDYDGNPVRLADHRGKVVLLNFWHPT